MKIFTVGQHDSETRLFDFAYVSWSKAFLSLKQAQEAIEEARVGPDEDWEPSGTSGPLKWEAMVGGGRWCAIDGDPESDCADQLEVWTITQAELTNDNC